MTDLFKANTAADLYDFAASGLRDPELDDCLVWLSMAVGTTRLGSVLRVRDARAPRPAVRRLLTAISGMSRLGDCGILLVIGPMGADAAALALVAQSTRAGLDALKVYGMHAGRWRDADTGQTGTYSPGASAFGLSIALDGGAIPAPAPLPVPGSAATVRPLLGRLSAGAALDHVRRSWPRLLGQAVPSQDDLSAALEALNTPGAYQGTGMLGALFPPARGVATAADVAAGLPQGADPATLAASVSLLSALVASTTGPACVGPLAALAYGEWVRGQGSRAHALLETARPLATTGDARAILRTVATMTGTGVAANATIDPRR